MTRRKQTLWILALNGVQIAVTALSFIRLANGLGPDGYGIFTFALTLGAFLPILAGMGADQVFVMHASRDLKAIPVLLGNAVLMRAATSIPLYVIVLSVAWIGGYRHLVVLGLLCGTALLMGFAQPTFGSYYRVVGRARHVWIAITIGQVVFCAYLYAVKELDVRAASLAYFISNVIVVVALFYDVRRRLRLRYDQALLKTNLRLGAFFSGSLMADFAFQRIDVMLTQVLLGAVAVGTYTAGYKLVALFLNIPIALHVVQLPDFHRAAVSTDATNSDFLQDAFQRLRTVLIELGAVLFGMILVNSGRIVDLVLDPSYASAKNVVAISSLTTFILFVTYPYSMLAEAQGKVEKRLWLRCAAVVFTGLLTAVLLKPMGVAGAAVGVALGSAFFLLLLHRATQPTGDNATGLLRECAPLLPATVAGLIVWLAHPVWGNGWIALLVSSASFALVFVALGSAFHLLRVFHFRGLLHIAAQSL